MPVTHVLIHGSGHTARVWDEVVPRLEDPARTVDLPGRRHRPADLTEGTIERSAAVVVDEVVALPPGPVLLVAHSSGGLLLPAVAARLGDRVVHLVFVAGLIAPDGRPVSELVFPDDPDGSRATLDELCATHRGTTFGGLVDGEVPTPTDLSVTEDTRLAGAIESLTLMYQPVSWRGVSPSLPRTFVACRRDPIQPPDLQARLVAAAGADDVVELDADHTPALSAPVELAAVLNRVAAAYR